MLAEVAFLVEVALLKNGVLGPDWDGETDSAGTPTPNIVEEPEVVAACVWFPVADSVSRTAELEPRLPVKLALGAEVANPVVDVLVGEAVKGIAK